MFTTESRVYLGAAALALVLSIGYAIGTDDNVGSFLFFSVFIAAAFLGFLFVRAGRLETSAPIGVVAEREGADRNLSAPTFWPLAAAVGVAVLLIGFTTDKAFFVLGVGATALAGLGWFAQTFRDHRGQADPNALIVQERIISPAGLPVLAAAAIGVVVVSFSRILLASSETGAWIVALAAAAVIMILCTLIALKPVSTGAITAIAGLAGLAVVVGGVAAAGHGERSFERHAVEPTEIRAKGTAFEEKTVTLYANETNEVRFFNADAGILHNVSFYKDEKFTQPVYQGQVVPGPGQQFYTFNPESAPKLYYRCDFHPEAMQGTAEVRTDTSEAKSG
jgi:hypothetical protein